MAASFLSASSQRILLGTSTPVWSAQPAGTISMWCRINAAAGGTNQGLVAFPLPNATTLVSFYLPAGGSVIAAGARRLNGDSVVSLTGPTLTIGQWYQLTITMGWSMGFFRLYVDGQQVASATPAGWSGNTQAGTTSTQAVIGANLGGTTFSSCSVQDLRTYQRALSAAEAAALFAAKGADRIRNGLYNRWILNNGIPGGTIGASAVRDYGPGQKTGSGSLSPTWSGAPLRTRPKAI